MNLDIITPEKTAYSQAIAKITVPGADGQLTILPNHTPLFVKLIEGELKVTEAESKNEFFMAIGGGFLEVNKNKIILLVTRAVKEDELNEKEILRAKEQAEKILKQAVSNDERQAAAALLHSRLLDLKILGRRMRGGRKKYIV